MRSSASFTASLQLLIVSDITLWHVSKMEMPHSPTGAAGADRHAISQFHNHIWRCCLFSYDKEDEFSGGICGFNGQE